MISVASDHIGGNGTIYNGITWRTSVEAFRTPRLHAQFKYYQVLRAPEPLGPWAVIDSVGGHDPRFLQDTLYVFRDTTCTPGAPYSYCVVSVDSLGGKSGMLTNMTPVQTVTGVRPGGDGTAPARFALEQNYPNPFNPTTEIGFTVDRTGRATMEVFNILGQKVTTLFDEIAVAGKPYSVRLGAGNLASGVYLYRLRNEHNVQTRKLVVLK